jgi:hypothetical protein
MKERETKNNVELAYGDRVGRDINRDRRGQRDLQIQ